MFNIRKLTASDYSILIPWWEWFKFPVPSREMLPEKGTGGLILSKGNTPIVAGFVYETNSSVAWIEFIISNPKYRDHDRKRVIETLIEALCRQALSKGFKAVFTSVVNENLINRLKACGFTKSKSKAYEMIKIL